MLVVLIIIVVLVSAVFIYSHLSQAKVEKADREKNEIANRELVKTYGEPTIRIPARCYGVPMNWARDTDINSQVIVFEPLKKILLKGKMYDFSQITGYTVSVNNHIVSSNTQTSTSSALGRAAVGGALLGGVGAAIGASTAKKSTEFNTKEETVITIFLDSLIEPSVTLDLVSPNKDNVGRIEGILRIITDKE